MAEYRILVVGGGGREHAIALACRRSALCEDLFCAPGSDAIGAVATCTGTGVSDVAGLLQDCKTHNINLVIVGPEAALVAGAADAMRKEGILVFGPGQAGAALEGSKIAAKEFMDRHGIPTARWSMHTDVSEALAELPDWERPPVIKAEGLAAGKGVYVPSSMEEAEQAIRELLEEGRFGEASTRILLEEQLQGEEVSWIAATDGTCHRAFPPSQDHKRIFDNDMGPNTGGMGAYAPTSLVTDALEQQVLSEVMDRFVAGLQADELEYRGAIYVGLMIVDGAPYVLEFNVRFGDPECQILLGGLESDFVELAAATARGELAGHTMRWRDGSGVIVVAASAGYPASSSSGDVIRGLEQGDTEDCYVVHAGTRKNSEGNWETAGGRVLGVVSFGSNILLACQSAYARMQEIRFQGRQIRLDIASRELKRQASGT